MPCAKTEDNGVYKIPLKINKKITNQEIGEFLRTVNVSLTSNLGSHLI